MLTIPVQAVCQKEEQHFTYVQGPRGFERREVTVGENNDKFVEIKTGLEEGAKVALDARARLSAEIKASDSKGEEATGAKKASPAKATTAASELKTEVKADVAQPSAAPVNATPGAPGNTSAAPA